MLIQEALRTLYFLISEEGLAVQINPSILNAKYIYLDWNVIKYMKESRLDKGNLDDRFKDMIF